jgi:hypothetical protein
MMINPFLPTSLDDVPEDELLPLATLLCETLMRRAPVAVALPDVLGVLEHVHPQLKLGLFTVPSAGSNYLCRALTVVLDAALTAEQRHERAWGSKDDPQRFRQRDCIQEPLRRFQLPATSHALHQRLSDEVPLLLRLLRWTRRFFWQRNLLWGACLQAAAIVLSRILLLWLALRRKIGGWCAHVCLRAALRKAWALLFGGRAPLPDALKKLPMTLRRERKTLLIFCKEGMDAGALPPEPFAELIARWQAGLLPPAHELSEEEEDQERCLV